MLRIKESSHFYLICLVYLLSTALFFPAEISAYERTLAWDANDEPDLEGYKLYSRVGDPCPPYNYIDAYPEDELANPLLPMVKVTNLEDDTKYYFVVTPIIKMGTKVITQTHRHEICCYIFYHNLP